MSQNTELAALNRYRAQLYRFLSRVYILEVDETLLSQMKQLDFPQDPASADLKSGYQLLADCVARYGGSDVIDLEVDYARIFLAAGVAQGLAAFPYESVYTSKKHLMNQEASSDVHILYAAKGRKAREDMYRIPDDHIGLEFEYMAELCEEAAKAAEDGADAKAEESQKEQKEFFLQHLNRWVPIFAGDVAKYAQTDFYKAIAKITRGFIGEEGKLMK